MRLSKLREAKNALIKLLTEHHSSAFALRIGGILAHWKCHRFPLHNVPQDGMIGDRGATRHRE